MTVPALTSEAPITIEIHPDRGHVSFSSAAQPDDVEQWLTAGGAEVLGDVAAVDVCMDTTNDGGGSLRELIGLADVLQRHFPDTPVRVSAPLRSAQAWGESESAKAQGVRPDGAQERRTLLTTKTLRSGTLIRFDGDVTVIGDVHSGAEVVATGNVSVLGKLSGMAHAGSDGDTSCFVFALQMDPTQIRVAQHISILPAGRPAGPEMARLEGDEVIALPLTARPPQT